MNTRRKMDVWRFGLMLVLLCIMSIPQLAGAGTAPPVPTGPLDAVNGIPDYYTTANWANSYPMAKFVNTLPGLGSGKANNLGQFLPVAVPDTTTYPGSDYYIIELREYSEKMHSDLNPTKLRGYVQVDATGKAIAPIHYLGPIIVAERDRPVRIKFTNKLPAGAAGDLFIPVDTTIMGSGTGPARLGAGRGDGVPCDNTIEGNTCASYTQNRGAIHLHGGRTPWISDGTAHQWITPVAEITPFTKGVSMQNVPDMPDPGDGSATYYYSNAQSARLMFYHDHAFGITRLNVYAGEAAGYVITDKYEQDLVTRGLIPPDQIPLIIQDKTFVDARPTTKYIYNPATGLFNTPITVPKVRETDPLWNWGSAAPNASGVRPPVTGDLWMPHVYMPAQNPIAGSGGVNPFGRWMYGPWFYPATVVTKGPVANPYYDQDCSSPFPAVYAKCSTPGQPPMIPGTPNVSMGMEAFQDSALVNGTAFPSLTVDPRAYRFRILNAANDRFWNLSFYVADPAQLSPDPRTASPMTEVKTVPASAALAAANNWPADWPVDGRDGGVPDPGFCQPGGVNCPNLGPSFLQIGTEGGFLPQPTVRVPQPVTYIIDPTAFWVGIVDKTGLALGPAERADVIVDFSAYAGKTLILYNDAPAAWPARVPGYDYYTGAPDMRDSGGYGTGGTWDPITGTWVGGTGPLVGYAPNTRTVMQVIVRSAPVEPPYNFNEAALAAEFTSAAAPTALNPAPVKTLFERAQEPIIVGQAAYSTTYPNSYFPPNFPWDGVNQINDHFLNFVTLAGQPVQMPTEPKGIHDEMGASFDPVYGRMSGNLAMQLPNPTTLTALLVLYGYSDLPTETIQNSPTVNVQVLGSGNDPIPWKVTDGTQIWKISHNGVDTHPIHFHIFDVQLINRVGWDGQVALPEPNELGWKDTVKISPLMDTIVAVRPRAPALPFGITKSLRPLNPAIPIGSGMGFNSVDWQTGQARIPAVTNELYDFGWEYVWHCHILSHEEMDMMRPVVLNVPTTIPDASALSVSSSPGLANLSWTDPTPVNYVTQANFGNPKSEIGFRIERCAGTGCSDFSPIGTALANKTTYTDTSAAGTNTYRVVTYNASGSAASNAVSVSVPPFVVAPTNLSGAISSATRITLTWTDNSNNETSFAVWRSINGGAFAKIATISRSAANQLATGGTVTFNNDGLVAGSSYAYYVTAVNPAITSAPTATVMVDFAKPLAPINLTAVISTATAIRLSWTDASTNESGFAVWRSINGGAFAQIATFARSAANRTATGGILTFTNSTLTAGNTYTYYVTAVNPVGTSTSSQVTMALTAPAAPTLSSVTAVATASTATVTATWTDVANEASYTVQRATNATFTTGVNTVSGIAANSTTTQQTLSRNVTYYYRVRSTNPLGTSAWSNVRSILTP